MRTSAVGAGAGARMGFFHALGGGVCAVPVCFPDFDARPLRGGRSPDALAGFLLPAAAGAVCCAVPLVSFPLPRGLLPLPFGCLSTLGSGFLGWLDRLGLAVAFTALCLPGAACGFGFDLFFSLSGGLVRLELSAF
jgi:hypothetical protein